MFSTAFAEDTQPDEYMCKETSSIGCYDKADIKMPYSKACLNQIDSLTNEDFLNEFNADKKTTNLNLGIEDSINQDVKQLESKILERLPQCKQYLQNISVPNLFYDSYEDGSFEEKNGSIRLKELGAVASFNPNPTNAVIANKSILFSDTGSDVFNSYLQATVASIGLKGKFIDSWDFAHIGGGELHCASHSINYCSPAQIK